MRVLERSFMYATRAIFAVGMVVFALFVGYLFYRGLQAFSGDLIFSGGELYPAIIGTLELVALSVLIAIPVGVGAGIYLGAYAKGALGNLLSLLFELLSSIPSIIIGLFGFALILALHKVFDGALPSLALAAASVAILVLPYIVKATQLGIEETPKDLITLAYSMGATHAQVIWHIQLPSASSHILKGIILALARASEDTAVIMLTGAVASYGIPSSIFEPFEALPFYIYTTTASYGSQAELGTIFVAAMILVSLAMVFVGLSGLLLRQVNTSIFERARRGKL